MIFKTKNILITYSEIKFIHLLKKTREEKEKLSLILIQTAKAECDQRLCCFDLYDMSLVMRKPAFYKCENKDTDQLRSNCKLISAFVFAT